MCKMILQQLYKLGLLITLFGPANKCKLRHILVSDEDIFII